VSDGNAEIPSDFGASFYPPSIYQGQPAIAQPVHIEIWVEKSTINEILIPLANLYRFNICTFIGEVSIPACDALVQRVIRSGRPCRILYVSDFDPAGRSMPVAAARKIEFAVKMAEEAGSGPLDIALHPIVLTPEQCIKYSLPRTPIKETERRAAAFEARFGSGATELDALEALHPGELRRILEQEINRFYDGDLDSRTYRASSANSALLRAVRKQVDEEFADQLTAIEDEWQGITAAFQEAASTFQDRVRSVYAEMARKIRDGIKDIPEPEWPEPTWGPDWGEPLFSSSRDYLNQVESYRSFQGKREVGHE
jgi:hypothetical protein